MLPLFYIFYLIIFFCYLVSALFIVFHISRYSLKKSNGTFGVILFLVVFVILLLTNISLFLNLPLTDMIQKSL